MKRRMKDVLSFRCSDATRATIERISISQEKAIAEVARELLDEGLKARGLMA
jgi:hypothetical protein